MRVLAIALVPSIALVVTGATFAALWIAEGTAARNWSQILGEQVDPLLKFVAAAQNERTYSFWSVGGDPPGAAALDMRRDETDAAIDEALAITQALGKSNPAAAARPESVIRPLLAQAPSMRHAVDTRQATLAEIDAFYTQLVGVFIVGIESTDRVSPDPETVVEKIVVADLVHATDLYARANGRAVAALADGGTLSPSDQITYTQLVGAFHSRLEAVAPRLTAAERQRYANLMTSPGWQSAIAAEGTLMSTGTIPVPLNDWLVSQDKVSAELHGLAADHFRYAERQAVDTADALLARGVAAALAVVVIAVVSLLIAMRIANALVRRLQLLRAKTLELAEHTLPSIVQRLRDGQSVDVHNELVVVDDGVDEIGQVADAFNAAQRTAVDAAAAEARTRGGINRVFLDIARRSQVVVHQQLSVLDTAESKQNDPEHLELLFQLDHLATRARRNAENLLILGGGQPGRKWHKPVSLEEIVRSAISETRDFTRVSAVRLPEVQVIGAAVADLIHMLAELIDNATSFSPPNSPVWVKGNFVGKGVVVEVEDQGLGIRFEERERLNKILQESPDFQDMALAGHRHLGLFVIAQLAQRHRFTVNLSESAYGGIKAIALVPAAVLARVEGTDGNAPIPSRADVRAGSRHQLATFTPQSVIAPVPRMAGDEHSQLPPWPVEPPTVQALPSPPNRSDRNSPEAASAVERALSTNGRQKAPLPHRQRQTHLAPQLRVETAEPTPTVSSTRVPRRRSPDDARTAMTSFQHGTRAGRDVNISPMDETGWSRNE